MPLVKSRKFFLSYVYLVLPLWWSHWNFVMIFGVRVHQPFACWFCSAVLTCTGQTAITGSLAYMSSRPLRRFCAVEMVHMRLTTPIWWSFVKLSSRGWYTSCDLHCTKFEDSSFSRSKDMKEDPKRKIGLIWGDWGRSRSLAMSPFDRAHRSSCSLFIETVSVFYRFRDRPIAS